MSTEVEKAEKKWAQVMEMIGRAREQRGVQARPTKAEVLCQGIQLEEYRACMVDLIASGELHLLRRGRQTTDVQLADVTLDRLFDKTVTTSPASNTAVDGDYTDHGPSLRPEEPSTSHLESTPKPLGEADIETMLSQQTAKKATEGAQKKRHKFHIQNYLAYPSKSERAIIPAAEIEALTKHQRAVELCAALRNNFHSTTVVPHASW